MTINSFGENNTTTQLLTLGYGNGIDKGNGETIINLLITGTIVMIGSGYGSLQGKGNIFQEGRGETKLTDLMEGDGSGCLTGK